MKKVVFGMLLIGCAVSANAGERAGLAESSAPFNVLRGEQTVVQRASALSEVLPGDVLSANEAPVVVRLVDGSSFAVGPNSKATLADGSRVAVESGDAAVSVAQGSAATVTANGLLLEPLSVDEKGTVLIVRDIADDVVEVQSVHGVAAVKNTATGEQVGVVGNGDVLGFRFSNNSWEVFSPALGQTEGVDGSNDAVTGGESSDDNDKGAWIVPAAVVGGAALLWGGYYLYDDHRDDNNNNDDGDDGFFFGGGGPTSPIDNGGEEFAE